LQPPPSPCFIYTVPEATERMREDKRGRERMKEDEGEEKAR
jgi:hypothetical protein